MPDFNFSIVTPAREGSADSSELTRVVDSALSTTGEKDRWEVTEEGVWCYLTPREYLPRTQGWKLHISATPTSAETVLAHGSPS